MRLLLLFLSLLLISCNGDRRSEIVYVYSKDKSQVVSIISDYHSNERIIAIGEVSEKPENNYVILDISDVTNLGDEIGVCWNVDEKGWQLVNDGAKIITVALDTTKYIIKTKWYEDEQRMPNTTYYRKENCFTFDMLSHSTLHPKENGIIERD